MVDIMNPTPQFLTVRAAACLTAWYIGANIVLQLKKFGDCWKPQKRRNVKTLTKKHENNS